MRDKRSEIIAASEKLFSQKGYDKTSLQDILDAAGISKGGFYHYFSGKDEVLDVICSFHTKLCAAETERQLADVTDTLQRLNIAISGMIPLCKNEVSFTGVIFPVIFTCSGTTLRVSYNEAMQSVLIPILRREFSLATDEGLIYPHIPEAETVVAPLLSQCYMELLKKIWIWKTSDVKPQASEMMVILDKYRHLIELVLTAQYGSILIVKLSDILQTAEYLLNL